LAEKDKSILDTFISYIFKDDTYQSKTSKSKQPPYNNYTSININGKYITHALISWGCTPKKSLTLKFPKINDEIMCKHFIRGYFDGDGTINQKHRMLIITSTLDFCQSMKIIMEKYTKSSLYICKYKNVYRLCAHGRNKVLKIFNWLYADANVFLHRKYDLFQKILCEKTIYFSDETINAFVDLHKSGMSNNKIAKMYHCSEGGVRKAIKRKKISNLKDKYSYIFKNVK
jgi:hypothetical protein